MTMNNATRKVAMVVVLSFALRHIARAQTSTTDTNCTIYSNTANCTSTTTDDSAQRAQQAAQQAERDRQNYETGQKIGAALGQSIAVATQAHAFNKGVRKYCEAHPGEDWHYRSNADGHEISSGHCPSDEDKVTTLTNEFVAHHKDFIRSPTNAQTLVTYLETNNLDPRERKSYEKAYKELKKAGKLELYSK
jgi:hypothetical protein